MVTYLFKLNTHTAPSPQPHHMRFHRYAGIKRHIICITVDVYSSQGMEVGCLMDKNKIYLHIYLYL